MDINGILERQKNRFKCLKRNSVVVVKGLKHAVLLLQAFLYAPKLYNLQFCCLFLVWVWHQFGNSSSLAQLKWFILLWISPSVGEVTLLFEFRGNCSVRVIKDWCLKLILITSVFFHYDGTEAQMNIWSRNWPSSGRFRWLCRAETQTNHFFYGLWRFTLSHCFVFQPSVSFLNLSFCLSVFFFCLSTWNWSCLTFKNL